MSKAAVVRWPSAATIATARRARRRSSTVCCAPPTAARSRSKCLKAIPAIPKRWPRQVAKLKQRFALDHVVLVGDRGMITQARIDEDLRPAGLDWITALRAPALQGLVGGGYLQMSLFDDRDMAAVTSPDFPGERLDRLPQRRSRARTPRKREDLFKATERDLAKIAAAVARKTRPLRGAAEIGLAVGAVLDRHKMAKHIELTISDTHLAYRRKTDQIAEEAALDGLYAVRTSLPKETLDDHATVRAYKSLSMVERAFRCLKTVDLHLRPIHHWLEATCPRACVPLHARPITWSGACAPASPRCSTTTTTETPPRPYAKAPSPRRNARPPPSQRGHRPHGRWPSRS